MVVALPSVGQLFCLSLLAVSGMLLEKVALLWSAFFFFFWSVHESKNPLQWKRKAERMGPLLALLLQYCASGMRLGVCAPVAQSACPEVCL